MTRKQFYWTDKQNQLVYTIINTSGSTKNRATKELYPSLVTMTESILKRYFKGNYNEFEVDDIVVDAITYLFLKLHQFNKEKGNAFSYCQTVIKNYFVTTFVKSGKKNEMWKSIMKQNQDIDVDYLMKHNYQDQQIEIEIISVNERIMTKLYSMRNEYKDLNNHVERKKVETLNKMIVILENNPGISYDRFLIELYEDFGLDIPNLNRKLLDLGFNFKGLYGVIYGYIGHYNNYAIDDWHGEIDWIIDDHPMSEKDDKRIRKYFKNKRNSR